MWWVGTPGAAVLAAGDFGGGETETHGFGFWILREEDVLSEDVLCGVNE